MNDHNWSEMVGAYVLGALDEGDQRAFEARLETDEGLQRLVDEAFASTLALADALPDLDVPSGLRADVLSRIGAGTGNKGGGDAAGGDAAGATSAGDGEVERGRASGDTASDRPRLEAVAGGKTRPAPGRPVQRAAPWLLLAASLAGLFYLGSENTEMRRDTDRLTAELEGLRASLGDAEIRLARFDSLAQAITGPNVQMASLTGDAEPSLRLVWNRDRELLLVAAQNLPALQPGRTYQLWGIRGTEAPVSLGTFDSDATGSALLTLGSVESADFEISAITDEPAGGSPGPTTTPFLAGAWSAVQ